MQKPRVLFVSHGGGPMPLLGDPSHADMVTCLQSIAAKIQKPSAILMVSAHWEANPISITSSAAPKLIYDYYGFPEPAYSIEYPSPGEPVLAEKVHQALAKANIDSTLNPSRGFDHGMYVPLKIMYPEADIPCVQLSLHPSLEPSLHLAIGEALQQLDYDNLLIIGSGFTFHNMRAFFTPETAEIKAQNMAFEQWLVDVCGNAELSEQQRQAKLLEWQMAPAARFSHPREEHLLPLHVCYGTAMRPCSDIYELSIANKQASMFLWNA
ncbi:class III extradiol ring-cleavage dioxygenase [Pseudoalteromonas sp. L21]|uniref:DODA-type extradiol aromatic ring-opening family dioxygenase n=1 Tax=Pseudoalteromonas sp. L21 TaxID=1539746 RepID=UPI001F3EBC60|nr:class III extradiol ring-cleavage dioxygenase [Pseudoalteromonas sp. L21]MCF7518111.1 dioxygenase [Pseudoalteromonas sp. L21]